MAQGEQGSEAPLVPDLLDAVLDAVTVGVVVRRPDGRPIATNAASRDLLGPDPAAVAPAGDVPQRVTLPVTLDDGSVGSVLATTVPIAPFGPEVHALVTTLQREEAPAQVPARPRGGRRALPSPEEEQEPRVRSWDAGGRPQQDLTPAERRLRATTEHSPVGMATIAPDGRILEANPALCRLLGRSADQLVGCRFAELGPAGDDPQAGVGESLARLLRGESDVLTLQRRYSRPVGDAVHAQVTLIAVRDEDGTALHVVAQVADVTEQRLAIDLLTHRSLHDPLTGLPNRTLGLDTLRRVLESGGTEGGAGGRVAVLCLDLDRFKVVNDSIGPEHGDEVLAEVAQRVRRALPARDTAARLSGDEFVVVCTGLEDGRERAGAVTTAERLLAAVREPVAVDGRVVVPTVSIGIALAAPGERDPMNLLRDAGAALHRAKENGQGTWVLVDDDLRRRAVDRLDIEHGLRDGVATGQLRLHLQPIVDLATGVTVGREALVRWQHPERGLLAPEWFLPVAEETGLIQDLGRWVLEEAARIAAASPQLGYVAVNVSPAQVRRASLLHDVRRTLERTGLDPSRLVLELTESVVLGTATAGRRQLRQLDALGVRMVVDDFGTGFAALSHLRELPVSGIKVDRTFTAGLGRDPQCDRIVEALTGLAKGLDVDLVAEGVETEDQRAVLEVIGCAHAQGYLFGRPEPFRF